MGKHRQGGRRNAKRGKSKAEEINPETRLDDIFEVEEVEAEEDLGAGRRFDVRFNACDTECLSLVDEFLFVGVTLTYLYILYISV
jgi:hypothetical protein